jgi:hypothetical protein
MNNNNNFNKEEFIQRLVESATEYENKYRQSLDETSYETKLKRNAAMKSGKWPKREAGGKAGEPGTGRRGEQAPESAIKTHQIERGLKKLKPGSKLDRRLERSRAIAARARRADRLFFKKLKKVTEQTLDEAGEAKANRMLYSKNPGIRTKGVDAYDAASTRQAMRAAKAAGRDPKNVAKLPISIRYNMARKLRSEKFKNALQSKSPKELELIKGNILNKISSNKKKDKLR